MIYRASSNSRYMRRTSSLDALEEYKEEDLSSEEWGDNNIISTNESFISSKKPRRLKNKVIVKERKGEWYEGEVDYNYNKQGHGVYHYENGDLYEGEFENGLRTGHGDYRWTDGSVFRGEWLNDKKNGFGSFKYSIYEFCGQWENDHFLSGFVFKININHNANDKDILSMIDKEEYDEFDSEANSLKFYSKTNSLVTSPLGKFENRKIKNDFSEENMVVKNFLDRMEKKFTTFHRMSKSIDIDLINFKPNAGDINIIKNLLSEKKTPQLQSLHTANNSITDDTEVLKSSFSLIRNGKESCSPNKSSKKLIKAYNIHSDLLKEIEFKCKTCLLSGAGIPLSFTKCTCNQIKEYIKDYVQSKSELEL